MTLKRLFATVLAVALAIMPASSVRGAEGVPVDEEHFPDENFRAYVSANCDKDEDGTLSDNEIAEVGSIAVEGKGICSLKGIENFTALRTLDCFNNQITTLDVSRNTKLNYLWCSGNQLAILDVGGCTALKKLDCYGNRLTLLDVRNCKALTDLTCCNNRLATLNLGGNTALVYLNCGVNQLTTLDLSQCTALTNLYCGDNQLTRLYINKNTGLKHLYCSDNQLEALDLKRNASLEHLYCADNQLTSLDVSKNTSLSTLFCAGNKFTEVDVSALDYENLETDGDVDTEKKILTVEPKPIPAEKVVVDCEELELTVGETYTLTATVEPEDATDKSVVWKSSDESIATVSDGLVTAVSPGTTTITATCGEVSASVVVTVSAQPDEIISVGEKASLKTAKKVAKVEVSDEAVVTAKAKKKKVVVKGVASGTVTVVAYDKKGDRVGQWVIKVE